MKPDAPVGIMVAMGILDDDMKRVVNEQSLAFVATVCPDEIIGFYERDRGLDPGRVHGVVLIEVLSAARLVSPSYDIGLNRAEIVDRSLRRLERVYNLRITEADDAGE